MVDLLPVFKILPIALVAFVSPGPDFLLISSLAMQRGRLAGFTAAAGNALGVMIGALLCMLGLGYVLAEMAWLLTAIKIVGGLYLIYLGIHLWKSSLKSKTKPLAEVGFSKKKHPFVMALVTNITNPKALAFNTSVFALVIKPGMTFATQATIVLSMGFLGLIWFSCVTIGLSTARVRQGYLRFSQWIDRVAGTFLAFFGLRLLLSQRN